MERKRLVLASIAFAAGMVSYSLYKRDHPSPGRFDVEAGQRIRKLCGTRTDCQVHLRDLSPLDWDTYYQFAPGTSDDLIQQALGQPLTLKRDIQRVIVLTKQGHIVYAATATAGFEHPIAQQVDIFCNPPDQTFMRCSSNTLLQVEQGHTNGDPARYTTASGPHYTLTETQ